MLRWASAIVGENVRIFQVALAVEVEAIYFEGF